ncbi:MAG TPA: PAS domain S-box protein [Candidatus Binatia bacterium]|nr:PAS domain S-box protein [Candidatus Binatia bacterium]
MIIWLGKEERATFERGATERTRALLTAVDSELRSSMTALQALASSGAFDADNLRGFYDEASRVLKSQPNWFTIILVSPTGRQVVNLGQPFGLDLPRIAEPASFDEALRTGKPTVGQMAHGPWERYAFAVRVPVIRGGAIKYVLTAVVDPQSISQLLLAQKLPSNWIGAVLDGNKRFVARTVEHEQNVGRLASEDLRAALGSEPEAWFRGKTIEGWDVYTPYNRSDFSGWTVAIGIPASAVDASLRQSFYFVSSFGLILLSLGITLAWFFGSRTANSIQSLARTAQNLDSRKETGAALTDVPMGIAEVESVREALLTAGRLIQERSLERDRIETALRQTSEWLELAQESASIGVFERNLVTGEIKWSVSQEKLYGIEPGSFGGKYQDWAQRVHPDDIATVDAMVRHSVETLSPFSAEFRIIRPDGSELWIGSKGRVFSENGTPLRMLGINLDITERKHAEQAKVRLAAIVESSDDAIISRDLNGIITSWNRGAEQIFGYRESEMIGKPITLLIPPDRQDEERVILDRIRRGERLEHYETVRQRKDKSLLDVSLTISPLRDGHGNIAGASKIARDITRRKFVETALRENEEKLRKQAQELEQQLIASGRLVSLGEVTASMAHEFNNPLGIIPTTSLECIAKICPCKIVGLRSLVTRGRGFLRVHKPLC